ncbi:unnamed protein product, partial [Amoebophrya sp. A120]
FPRWGRLVARQHRALHERPREQHAVFRHSAAAERDDNPRRGPTTSFTKRWGPRKFILILILWQRKFILLFFSCI